MKQYLLCILTLLTACGEHNSPAINVPAGSGSNNLVTEENADNVLDDLIQDRQDICYAMIDSTVENFLAQCQLHEPLADCQADADVQSNQIRNSWLGDVVFYRAHLRTCIITSLGEPIMDTLCASLFDRSLGSTIASTCTRGIY